MGVASSLEPIRAGSEIYLEWETRDMTLDNPQRLDPDTVDLTLIDPEETVFGPFAMTKKSTGIYTYTYQTSPGSAPGDWLGDVQVTVGSGIVRTRERVLFTLTSK